MEMGVVSVERETLKKAIKLRNPPQAIIKTVIALLILTASSDGFCQLSNAGNKINALSIWLAGLSLAVFTIATMYVGYKCLFLGVAFRDVWNVLFGGFLVGGAAGLAAYATS